MSLAQVDYEEPDSAIISQAISQQTQMQEFLHNNGPFVPVPIRATPIAIQTMESLKKISNLLLHNTLVFH